jgi:hypothetical protein
MEGTATEPQAAGPRAGDFRPAPGLEGVNGRLRLQVGDKIAATLEVNDGYARLGPAEGAAEAVAILDSEETVRRFQRGELNPVVAALQGRLELKGDLAFAIKVILGLQVAHPFADGQGQGKGA